MNRQWSRDHISELVITCLKELLLEKKKLTKVPHINGSTQLIGPQSVLDSLELVTFVVELEQRLQEPSIVLADESAMSRTDSPFKTVQSLINHILSRK